MLRRARRLLQPGIASSAPVFRRARDECARNASTAADVIARKRDTEAALLSGWEIVVGLELHVQIKTVTKLFSRARLQASGVELPNENVALFDVALPGTLPRINRAAVEATARMGFAVGGTVHAVSRFDRKHYFYADLPHGYQITQQRQPLVSGGAIDIGPELAARGGSVPPLLVPLERIHLEMDTGKSSHVEGGGATRVDYSRAGAALMEIVTAPTMRSGAEAAACVRALRSAVRAVGAGDAHMEDGNLRVDVNVSLRDTTGARASSPRCEIKNLNSIRAVARAVAAEATRHAAALASGRHLTAETRGYDTADGITVPLRAKETALDYRFMAEPDLPPLRLTADHLNALRASALSAIAANDASPSGGDALHELPPTVVAQLRGEAGAVDFWEAVMEAAPGVDSTSAAAWVASELVGAVRAHNRTSSKAASRGALGNTVAPAVTLAAWVTGGGPSSPARVADLLSRVASGEISARMAKQIQAVMVAGDNRPLPALADSVCGGTAQLSDDGPLRTLCAAAVAANLDRVAELRGGRDRLMALFVGEVMAASGGRADPRRAAAILREIIFAEGSQGKGA